MYKKIAVLIVILLVMVGMSVAVVTIPNVLPSCKGLHGIVDELGDDLGLFFYYYGWEDGLSVLLIDHVSLNQAKPGELYRSRGTSGGTHHKRIVNFPWLRTGGLFEAEERLRIEVRSAEGKRDVEVHFKHEFVSVDPFLAKLNIKDVSYEISSDTIFFIDHELDDSFTVNQIDIDLTDLVGGSTDGSPGMRGVPTTDEIKAYLLQSSTIEELLHAGDQEQK